MAEYFHFLLTLLGCAPHPLFDAEPFRLMDTDPIARAQSKRLGVGRRRLLVPIYSTVVDRLIYASDF